VKALEFFVFNPGTLVRNGAPFQKESLAVNGMEHFRN
jgi:hypothetical protein